MTFTKRSSGFTLAEVLITLGVLGIVASWTLPSLVKNYQNAQYVTGLKRAVSALQQGFKNYMSEQGTSQLGDTLLFNGNEAFGEANRQNIMDAFVKKYFKVMTTETNAHWHESPEFDYDIIALGPVAFDPGGNFGDYTYKFRTIDGISYGIMLEESCNSQSNSINNIKAFCGSIMIDINGNKKPNKYGRDIFFFIMIQDGSLIPGYGTRYAQFRDGTENIINSNNYWQKNNAYCGRLNSSDLTNVLGWACAARIIEEGWRMTY